MGKFPDISKVLFQIGNERVRIPPRSASIHGVGEEPGVRMVREGPQSAGFCKIGRPSPDSDFTKSEANCRKVSTHYREYSRFRETFAEDFLARSPLDAGSGIGFLFTSRAAKALNSKLGNVRSPGFQNLALLNASVYRLCMKGPYFAVRQQKTKGHAGITPRGLRDCSLGPPEISVSGHIVCGWRRLSRV